MIINSVVSRVVSLKTGEGSKEYALMTVKFTQSTKRCGLSGETSQTENAGWRQSEAGSHKPQAGTAFGGFEGCG